jgi:hypothetical protein
LSFILLLDYRHHKRWIWGAGGIFLFASGLYVGLHPANQRLNLLLFVGISAALAVGLVVLRRLVVKKAWSRLAWLGLLLIMAAAGSTIFSAGYYLGHRWCGPAGPSANSVPGIWFGIAGTACMVYAAILSVLRRVPSWWWIGSRQWWLKGHIWLGLLSAPLILYHSTFRLGGLLEQVLWILLVVVLVTGVAGLLLQQFLPHLMTTRVAHEVPYEQIPHECTLLRRKADALIEVVCGRNEPDLAATSKGHLKIDSETKARLRNVYESVVRPYLDWPGETSSPLAEAGRADAVFRAISDWPGLVPATNNVEQLIGYCKDRRRMADQERLHQWLHVWLLFHVPPAALLVVLGVVHGFVSVYF